MNEKSIWVGFDKRETAAFAVTCYSVRRHLLAPITVRGLVLSELRKSGLYTRPSEQRTIDGHVVTWDLISDAPQSTEHANARFLVPHLAQHGWALFMDGDMLALDDISEIFADLDDRKALYCVHHDYAPIQAIKMDGQQQTLYSRKNQSSLVIFNCEHEANKALTVNLVNSVPGRDLHRFCWLTDELIGKLSPEWNFLVGHSDSTIKPKIVHFTEGTPDMPGYEGIPYAKEWRTELADWNS